MLYVPLLLSYSRLTTTCLVPFAVRSCNSTSPATTKGCDPSRTAAVLPSSLARNAMDELASAANKLSMCTCVSVVSWRTHCATFTAQRLEKSASNDSVLVSLAGVAALAHSAVAD